MSISSWQKFSIEKSGGNLKYFRFRNNTEEIASRKSQFALFLSLPEFTQYRTLYRAHQETKVFIFLFPLLSPRLNYSATYFVIWMMKWGFRQHWKPGASARYKSFSACHESWIFPKQSLQAFLLLAFASPSPWLPCSPRTGVISFLALHRWPNNL